MAMQHYEGVRLSDLSAKAGVPLGDKLRGRAMAIYVLAQASDWYAVLYSVAELEPAMTDNRIMVAHKMNGKPLDPKGGPSKVVVPGDKRPARWICMLTALRWKRPSVLLNQHLGSLDDGRDGVPLLEVQLVGAPTRDCTLNQVFADTHDDMSHDSAKHDFLNPTFESVSR